VQRAALVNHLPIGGDLWSLGFSVEGQPNDARGEELPKAGFRVVSSGYFEAMGIPLLAALTPPEFEVELLDDNSGQPIDYDAPTDLVAINCFTPQATRAFEIADGFRAHGKKVIMGGLFPTFMADECLKHADAVNIGEDAVFAGAARDIRHVKP